MYEKKATIEDVKNWEGKKVLVRVDFNVPLKDGKVADDTRIKAALPTVRYLVDRKAKIVLVSHLGRPKGKVVEELRMDPVAERLKELLGAPVVKLDVAVGDEVKETVESMTPGSVVLLENIRFYPGEEENDPEFARKLAEPFDIYVNDAFGTAHRAHASTEGVAHYLPAVAGFLMKRELEYLGKVVSSPEKPFVIILGGVKLETKLPVIKNLLDKADVFLIGGAMAYTFIKAEGRDIGASFFEEDKLDVAKETIREARMSGVDFVLPEDHVAVNPPLDPKNMILTKQHKVKVFKKGMLYDDWEGVDIGPRTVKLYSNYIKQAETIFWNGPMGVFEIDRFSKGTVGIAKAVASSRAISVVGGGDSVAAVNKAGVADKISHISTGGGASLKFVSGKPLPGVVALWEKEKIREAGL